MARILLIDDDEAFRALLVLILTEAGHAVIAASNGLEALKLFRAQPAELIVTDLMMPYEGLAMIRILRSEFPQLGIIAMSGGGAHRLDYARSLGAHQTLMKPFGAQELTSAVTAVLGAHPLSTSTPSPGLTPKGEESPGL